MPGRAHGGRASAALRPIEGGEQIARYLVDIAGQAPGNVTFLERTVNGQPGPVAQQDDVTVTPSAFDIARGRITHIRAVRIPGKTPPPDDGLTRDSMPPAPIRTAATQPPLPSQADRATSPPEKGPARPAVRE
jgi:hypothetical protein